MYRVAGITTGSLLFLRSMTVIPAVAGQTIEFVGVCLCLDDGAGDAQLTNGLDRP